MATEFVYGGVMIAGGVLLLCLGMWVKASNTPRQITGTDVVVSVTVKAAEGVKKLPAGEAITRHLARGGFYKPDSLRILDAPNSITWEFLYQEEGDQ